jgi:beta-lactamase superfamily II metal-dependent hydrolase
MENNKAYFCVNSQAPRDGILTLFCKKVGEQKSDGFALIENGKIFMIDVGKDGDGEMVKYLLSVREKWLTDSGNTSLVDSADAKLELHVIVSHAHPDHMAALPLVLTDPRFCVLNVYAPTRAYLSLDVPGALPPLVRYENNLDKMCKYLEEYNHQARSITRIDYGKALELEFGSEDTRLEIYPSHFDWSEDRPSDKEGFKFILTNNSATYKDRPLNGYTNGILNGNSLWVKIITGRHSVLITGDQRASDEMLGAMIRYYGENAFDCDVLKLTHHGEHNCPTYLIEAAKPKIAVFTTSREKADRKAVALCEKAGCENYYTGEGDLLLTVKSEGIKALGISLE